jgi:hypothetical protein
MRFACFSSVTLLVAFGTVSGEPPRPLPAARPDEPVAKAFAID